ESRRRLYAYPYAKYRTNPIHSQTPKRHHDRCGSCDASTRHETAPNIGTSHAPPGTRNGRSRLGSLKRSTVIPIQTRKNANSVPIFVKSTMSSRDEKRAATPTKTPVTIVPTCGVLNLGCTLEKNGHRRPSRDMAKKMRGCPS